MPFAVGSCVVRWHQWCRLVRALGGALVRCGAASRGLACPSWIGRLWTNCCQSSAFPKWMSSQCPGPCCRRRRLALSKVGMVMQPLAALVPVQRQVFRRRRPRRHVRQGLDQAS